MNRFFDVLSTKNALQTSNERMKQVIANVKMSITYSRKHYRTYLYLRDSTFVNFYNFIAFKMFKNAFKFHTVNTKVFVLGLTYESYEDEFNF